MTILQPDALIRFTNPKKYLQRNTLQFQTHIVQIAWTGYTIGKYEIEPVRKSKQDFGTNTIQN